MILYKDTLRQKTEKTEDPFDLLCTKRWCLCWKKGGGCSNQLLQFTFSHLSHRLLRHSKGFKGKNKGIPIECINTIIKINYNIYQIINFCLYLVHV